MEKPLPRTQAEVLRELSDSAGGRSHAYRLKQKLKSRISRSSVYAAIAELQTRGYIDSEWGPPAREGLPPRRYVEINALGAQALAGYDALEDARSHAQSPRPAMTRRSR